jgi:aspartate/glutamate racemase
MKTIGLLDGMSWESTAIPLFDTTAIHAKKAVEISLS